jgi:predicted phage tail protein
MHGQTGLMREIRVYGKLAKFLKRRVFRAEIANVAEAVRFLLANFPHVEAHMLDQHYRVSLDGSDVDLNEIHQPVGQETIKIVPVIAGAGTVGRIIAGVALIAASFIPGVGALGVSLLFGVGASLALGGVSQLLSPVPVTPAGVDSPNDPRKAYSFSSIQNTSRSGTPVPIVYGETIVGSVVISAGIDISQVQA